MSPVNTVIDQIYDNSLCFAESFWMEMGTMEEKTFSHLPWCLRSAAGLTEIEEECTPRDCSTRAKDDSA